jgi:mRNA interferase RelE/StbE
VAWKIEYLASARKDVRKLDVQVRQRIRAFLEERVASSDDPRSIGADLTESRMGEFWKYRVGDWRIVTKIEDERLVVLVVRIGNRREVYRQ